ncbi:splicing factor 3B subunit 1-like [Dorcoceras hygrometricum]|uniref:Splicing factor 3B subunit 1-like n=1 Tax=Dorcoceras hygrometricum TaxID=472368 RepID=A0A2Z7CB75_9LAMI|nr:splicing factor 3B subunit 1-like [Dorcoceras hygrometricum]
MASFTAPKQLLQEPLKSGEDDDMSGFKQPSKIIESAEMEETYIEPIDTEELSLAMDVATMTESEDTGSVSKSLELTVSTTSDEESMSLEDFLKQIPAYVMLPSVIATEITRIKFARMRFQKYTKVTGTRPVFLELVQLTMRGHRVREQESGTHCLYHI